MLGTTLGGVIGSFLNIKSNKKLGFILEFAAGLMTSIICFDLIPEGLAIGAGFEASSALGISLAIAIAIHDIPEGIFQSRHRLKYA